MLAQQPTRRFGQPRKREQREAAQRTQQEHRAPAPTKARHEPQRDDRHDALADHGEHVRKGGIAAAHRRGRHLADVGGDHRDFGADTHAGDETTDHHRGEARRKRGRDAARREQHRRHRYARAAPDGVREIAVQPRTGYVADEARGNRQRLLLRAQVKDLAEYRQTERDIRDVEERDQIADADHPDDRHRMRPRRQSVEPRHQIPGGVLPMKCGLHVSPLHLEVV